MMAAGPFSRPAIATLSLGRAQHHSLREKLLVAHSAGFEGVELFYEDLEVYAKRHCLQQPPATGLVSSSTVSDDTAPSTANSDSTKPPPPLDVTQTPSTELTSALVTAAAQIHYFCVELDLTILCLQPFSQFEGRRNRQDHNACLRTAEIWFQIAHALGTDIIHVASTFLPDQDLVTGDNLEQAVTDLRELADMASSKSPPLRIAYESLGWGTVCDTWETSWGVVKSVDRPNFGLCLDTFNMAGKIYADPASADGKTENAAATMDASLARLVKHVDPSRVFFVEVADAERLSSPLVKGHSFYVEKQPARMSWSRNCRLFYDEEDHGGYLPISQILKAICTSRENGGLGFEGWISMEVFSRTAWEPHHGVIKAHADRARRAREVLNKDGFLGMRESK